jgi:hypothetical protein
VWSEIWDVIGPQFRQVLTTGRATWVEDQRLLMDRYGFLEETYFTYSYSPILDDDGDIGGVLDIATETTGRVVTARRMATVTSLAANLLRSRDVDEVRTRTCAALPASDDIESAELSRAASAEPGGVRVLDTGWARDTPARAVAVTVGGSTQRHRLVLRLCPNRPFDDDYRAFVELVASTVGAALETTHLRGVELDAQLEISGRLQEAMLELTTDFPTVAARYAPATNQLRVGGDWYDVVDLGDGRRGLVVGDCVGHGLDAAIAMGQLRSACRALLLAGASPAEVLTALDRVAAAVRGGQCATVACIVIDVRSGTLAYACAGHPPPLVVGHDGTTSWLTGGRGMPLAVGQPERHADWAPVAAGDTIVLYTDGLIERRGEDLDAGLARLAEAARGAGARSVQQVADDLLRLADGADDDVAIVIKRVPSV